MNYRYRMFSCIKEDGNRIAGKVYFPDEGNRSSERRYPAVIFCHGFGVTYRDLEHYGPWFASQGVICLLFDFCGGSLESESDGATVFMSVLTEEEDLLCVRKNLEVLGKSGDLALNPDQIFLMGESQGGYVAALTGVEYPELTSGLILWYPAFCLQDMASAWKEKEKKHYAREMWGIPLGRKYTDDAYRIPIYDKIHLFMKAALIIHGDADEIVDPSYSERAVRTFPHAELKMITGGGHGFEGSQCQEAAQTSMYFIERVIKGQEGGFQSGE